MSDLSRCSPQELGSISPRIDPWNGRCLRGRRLQLTTTLHSERFDEGDLAAQVDDYDRRRAAARPYRNQRDAARFGRAEFYGWSEDKARQYAVPQREGFGAYVRAQGFHLD